ncbi:MAG: hypothetical protein NVSMB24_26750 [Mucilaginibacter sp.]
MKKIVLYLLVLFPFAVKAQVNDTLYVYGPGGPLAPFQECGKLFTREYHIPVKVTGGQTAESFF